MQTCFETTIAGFPIKLQQHGRDSFRVVYGKSVKDRLTYGKAATELGAAIMHALSCEGRVDNREKGEG